MKTTLKQPYKQFFGTLANQIRLDIIRNLRNKDKNVGSISDSTGYSQSTVSHSLKRLEECGFVSVKQDGKNRVYSLNQKTIKPLFELMEDHMNCFCKKIVKKGGKNDRS
jgi:DNA-binding transcriptional ArsR family regulator